MSREKRFGRRAFLRGAGGALLALPLLEYTHGKAFAQSLTAPKRFIVVFRHGGTLSNIQRYKLNTPGWRLSGNGEEQGQNLWNPSDPGETLQLNTIHSILESHKSKLLVVTGVDNASGVRQSPYEGDHRWANKTILTANDAIEQTPGDPDSITALGPSIDQVIASRLAVTQPVPFNSVNLMVTGHQYGTPFFRAARQSVASETRPSKAFDTYFGGFTPSGEPDPALVKQRQVKQSVLAGVLDGYKRFESKVSSADRQVIDAHLSHLSDLEKRVQALATVTCVAPTVDRTVQAENTEKVGPLLADIIVAAMRCGLTNVATLEIADVITPWLGDPLNLDIGHSLHHIASACGKTGQYFSLQQTWINEMISNRQWCMGLYKRILDGLAATPEGNGTMLDNSVVFYTSEFSNGSFHSVNDMPLLVAGSGGGYFRTGRHINCNLATGAGQYQSRTSTHNLFTSFMNAMGLPDAHFGNTLCEFQGPLPGLV